MKIPRLAVLTLLILPAMAMAQENAAPQSLVVPGVMTTSGHRFAEHCTDAAFTRSTDVDALARRCQTLLARWRGEVDLVLARRGNPRIRGVASMVHSSDAALPFDSVAALRSMPLQMSFGR